MLAVYALGMAAPLFLMTLLWQKFDLSRRRWLRGRQFQLGRLHLHTTSTISGLLFVIIGVTFVVSGGAGGLLSLDPGVALKVEDAVAAIAAHIPDAVVLLGLAAVVAGVVGYRLRRERAVYRPDPVTADDG